MVNKVCFLFGHSTTPWGTFTQILETAEKHYLEYGVRTFVVGNRGGFDSYAATAEKY